jgi:hypothetical protein
MLKLTLQLELSYKQAVQLIGLLLMLFPSWFQNRSERGGLSTTFVRNLGFTIEFNRIDGVRLD